MPALRDVHRLRPRMSLELAVDVLDVGLHRVRRDEEPLADLAEAGPCGDALEDSDLALGQHLRAGYRCGVAPTGHRRRAAEVTLEQMPRERRADRRFAGAQRVDRGDEIGR